MPNPPDSDTPHQPHSAISGGLPLAGQTILVTRAAQQSDSLRVPLENLGAEIVVHPVISLLPVEDYSLLDSAISRISDFDWIVFVSANGVKYFNQRLTTLGGSAKDLPGKIAAIGAATLRHLKHVQPKVDVFDLLPPKSNSAALAQALIGEAIGQRVLIVRANRGSQELSNSLKQAGIEFEELVVYQSVDVEESEPEIASLLGTGKIDWVTITSSAIARSTIRLFGEDLRKSKLVSISPTTSAALLELGFKPAAEAKAYNMGGIVDAIVRATGKT